MANCSKHTNPLKNTGTSQIQRFLPGLDKNKFALADEKNFADWIVFASDFADFINYYNLGNTVSGNWNPFFSSDISAQLGTIALQNISRYQLEIKQRLDYIRNDDHKTNLAEIRTKLNELFSIVLTLSSALDGYSLNLPDETSLKQTIRNLIKTSLSPTLRRLIAYYKAAKDLHFLNTGSTSPWLILNKPLTDAGTIISGSGLSPVWYDNSIWANWENYQNNITPDDSIFNNPLTEFSDEFLSIEHAANHNLFTGIFDNYLSAYTKIIQEAESELLKTLESYDAHTPHYALFLSFLMLFRFAQTHLNTITGRHLDFYYKEVLRLQPRAAEANKVHVLAELAKQIDNFLLKQGTLLKAGKDSLNREVNYKLDADTVFSKAKVAQLKTYYKASAAETIKQPGTSAILQDNAGRVFASPASNTDDGLEAALSGANKEWHPYVNKVYKEAQLDSITMPKALLGFALASHYLYLSEGERKVAVRLVTNNDSALIGKHIECYLTTEKDWYKVESLSVASSGKKLSDGLTNCCEIAFTIPGSAPAIVNYKSAIHGGNFDRSLPMLKLYLLNDDAFPFEYDALKNITVTKTEIKVEVGMDGSFSQKGLKNLQLSNDFGTLDASKPFMPFGSQPKKDAGFVLGHKEIFSKKNTLVKLNIEWAELPLSAQDIRYDSTYASVLNTATNKYSYTKNSSATPYYPKVQPSFLQAGIWTAVAETDIFNNTAQNVQVFPSGQTVPQGTIVPFSKPDYLFNSAASNGFLKLVLKGDFGHSNYLMDLSKFLIEKSKSDTSTKEVGVQPTEPYTPKIKSIYLSYSANCITDLSAQLKTSFDQREICFYHLYPFGEGEQHKFMNPAENVHLLPQFKHFEKGESKLHIGEFYIGIENLKPGEAVNLLVQVMEGTTNPKVPKPARHLHWAFLSNNQWIEFEASKFSDNTLQLVQSGILSFPIPETATTTNTILPTGFIWLRAAVTEATDAVCKLISVDAQAALATFSDNQNAPDFLNTALPAGSVTKLKTPEVAVKKVTQPYSSFGGKPVENDEHFYTRVSERLRHKARAITVWDYEHLVLEAFPEIYKVKCLNHTQIEDGIYHEVKPGYVSIITIPVQSNIHDSNPLKPFTQQSTLTKIENYLSKRVSCFVKLRACQPQFEEIRLEFTLKLHAQYQDFTYYSGKLKEEITQFLSPWAFGNSSSIDFGGKVYKSVLINFIEERYYVDIVTNVFMYVKIDESTNPGADFDEISASTARSILVSAPASKHMIHPFPDEIAETSENCSDKNLNK